MRRNTQQYKRFYTSSTLDMAVLQYLVLEIGNNLELKSIKLNTYARVRIKRASISAQKERISRCSQVTRTSNSSRAEVLETRIARFLPDDRAARFRLSLPDLRL